MVMPSPFQRLLQQCGEQANSDPAGAFERLDELYGKSQSAEDVQYLAAFAANLGGAALGRIDETLQFLDRLMEHPAIPMAEPIQKSIWRAKAVLHIVADDEAEADACKQHGVTNATEACRLAIMAAQTLVARQLAHKAIPHIKQSAALCQELAADDPIVRQVAQIAINMQRLAEQQTAKAHELLRAASSAVVESLGRAPDWQQRHMGLFQRARALITIGNPSAGLAMVQKMMQLEREHEAAPFFQFQSASLACRAQLIRGQIKIARAAFQACQGLAKQVDNGQWQEQVTKTLDELSDLVTASS